jgi:ribosomal protein S18 acetylase RimI-like enzyme
MTTLIPQEQLILPDGYTARPIRMDDAEMLAAFITGIQKITGYSEVMTADILHEDWTMPDFNLETSSCLVLASDGTPVGMTIVWDRVNPPVHPWLHQAIQPEHFENVASWLMQWAETRAIQALDRCPPESRFGIRIETRHGYHPHERLYQDAGYTPIRHFYRMRIDLTEAPETPTIPDGFTLRPYQHPEELPDMVRLRNDAFSGHFGYIERPLEDVLRDWEHGISSDKLFDPTLWFVAIDNATGEKAGLVMGRIEDFEDPTVAYIDLVGVRQAYRKRGLASFLLRQAFAEFWRRGRPSTTLHVDAGNTTGALRLYQNNGMFVERDYAAWEKQLRDGVELSNLALGNGE